MMRMKIEISIVDERGERTVIGTNERLARAGTAPDDGWNWQLKAESAAVRMMTYEQAWAASFLCMHMACERLPVPTLSKAGLAAAHAYHKWEQDDRRLKVVTQDAPLRRQAFDAQDERDRARRLEPPQPQAVPPASIPPHTFVNGVDGDTQITTSGPATPNDDKPST